MPRLNSRERSSISRAFAVNRTYIRNWRSPDAPGDFALDAVDALDERQTIAELLARRVGQRSRHQGMRDRVECRLCGEAEDVVVERRRFDALSGHLGESRHPVGDEPLGDVRRAPSKRRPSVAAAVLGHDDVNGQRAQKHAGNDDRRSPATGQRHSCSPLSARKYAKN